MKTPLAHRQTVPSISTPRGLGYATAAAATAALGHAETAEASVVVVTVDQNFDAPDNSLTVRGTFALGSGGADFGLKQKHFRYGSGIAVAGAGGGASLRGFRAGSGAYASKLALGQPIKGGSIIGSGVLAAGSNHGQSQWQTPGTGYLGFTFTDAGGAETGWAEITIDAGQPSNTFTLDEYAYGTAGESLTAGEVPEPGSLALLALGGAGLLAWRQRRAAGV